VVDTQLHGTPQYRQRLVTVTRRTEHARAGQLHRAEADARYGETAKRVTQHGQILVSLAAVRVAKRLPGANQIEQATRLATQDDTSVGA
jgi:hypothetical protein